MKEKRRQVLKYIGASLMSGSVLNGFDTVEAFGKSAVSFSARDSQIEVINAGVGGNTSRDLLNRVEKDCYAHRPDLTILMAGTNDMNSVKYIPLVEYEENMRKLAKGITDKGSKLILMTILPCYEPDLLTRHPAKFYQPEGVDGRRKAVNNVIKKIAADYGAYLLDLEHRFLMVGKIGEDADSLIKNMNNSNKRDGIHPTANGYRFIGLTVYDFIINKDISCSRIVCFGDSITKGDLENYPAYLKSLLT